MIKQLKADFKVHIRTCIAALAHRKHNRLGSNTRLMLIVYHIIAILKI